MRYLTEADYDALSRQVCDILLDTIKKNPKAVIVLPTGNSPLGAYRLFVKRVREEKISLEKVTFIQLDEWAGLDRKHPSSCRYFLEKEFIEPLAVKPARFIEFHGEAKNLQEECKRVEKQIKTAGQISLVMLGVGKNGHIGLNEPSDEWQMSVHPVQLSRKSMTHSMLAGEQKKPTQGLTMGLELFFDAEKVLLIVTGSEKKDAVVSFFQDTVSPHCPASILKLHANAVCVIEEELYKEAVEKGK